MYQLRILSLSVYSISVRNIKIRMSSITIEQLLIITIILGLFKQIQSRIPNSIHKDLTTLSDM